MFEEITSFAITAVSAILFGNWVRWAWRLVFDAKSKLSSDRRNSDGQQEKQDAETDEPAHR
jgi:hypothetical protein